MQRGNNGVYYRTWVDQIAVVVTEELPYKIRIEEIRAPLVQSGTLPIKVIAERKEGFKGAINVKLQMDQGFGRTYFYETSGDFRLEDLSGNTVVKGSAGSVGLGRQETVDDMLGLRAFNLRSALKRYASEPKSSDDNMAWGEIFGFSSPRIGTDTLLKHDATGFVITSIHLVILTLALIFSFYYI